MIVSLERILKGDGVCYAKFLDFEEKANAFLFFLDEK